MFTSLLKRENHYYKFSLSLYKHDKSFSFSINYLKAKLTLSPFRILVNNFMIRTFSAFFNMKIILLLFKIIRIKRI